MKKLSNITKRIALLTASSLAIVFIQRHTLQNSSSITNNFSSSTDLTAEEYSLSYLKATPSLGFDNLVANYTFVQFLLYFGDDEARSHAGYKLSPDFFETIIHRDPYFKDFYLFLSQSTSVYAGLPDRAIKLMNEGVRKLAPNQPRDGYHIWRYKGVDELLFAGDSKSAQHSFETAANWAAQSSEPDSQLMGQMSQQTAQFLATDPDSKQAQISSWTSVFMTALDDETRMKAVEEIRELGGDVVVGEDGGIRIEHAQTRQKQSDDSDG